MQEVRQDWQPPADIPREEQLRIVGMAIGTREPEEVMTYGKVTSEQDNLSGKYIIWCPESSYAVRFHYDDKPTAIKAAYAMAGKNPSQRFLVCKVEGLCKTTTVTYEDFNG